MLSGPTKKLTALSTTGLPSAVPGSSAMDADDEMKRNLERGSHSSHGGDKGNDYQALWMMLACANSMHAAKDKPQLVEIILEGKREPFDDVEILKSDKSLTLFQSKHRQKKGSNNVLISELTASPSADSKASKAFSLLKYFKGMMQQYYTEGSLPGEARFIVCVSAPLSTTITTPAHYNFGQNFWETSGILQPVAMADSEPLLRSVMSADKQEVIADMKIEGMAKPLYMRFSDQFIHDQLTAAEPKKMRAILYGALETFIKTARAKKEAWVCWDEDGDKQNLVLFFTKFEIWLKQPNVDQLKHIVMNAFRVNFVLGAVKFQERLLQSIKNSAAQYRTSLTANKVKEYFTQVRGSILLEYLSAMSDQYKEEHYLHRLQLPDYKHDQLINFLKSQDSILIINTSAGGLRNLCFSTFVGHFSNLKPAKVYGEKWFLVDYNTKPLYYVDEKNQGHDLEAANMFFDDSVELIVIDNADKYFQNNRAYSLNILRNLLLKILQVNADREKRKVPLVKIIFISNATAANLWEQFFRVEKILKGYCRLDVDNNLLNQAQVTQVLQQSPGGQVVEFFPGMATTTAEMMTAHHTPLLAALGQPDVLKDFLHANKDVKVSTQPLQQSHTNYQPIKLPVSCPIYTISNLLANREIKQIVLSPGDSKMAHAELLDLLQKATTREWQHDAKEKSYTTTKETAGSVVHVKLFVNIEQKDQVTVVSMDAKAMVQIPFAHTQEFVDDKNDIPPVEIDTLLNRSAHPQRVLLSAEYGTGKSTALTHLRDQWRTLRHTQPWAPGRYEFVLLIRLPFILNIIKRNVSLIDALDLYLVNMGDIASPLRPWHKAVLNEALIMGHALLLFDSWDEISDPDKETIVNPWLKTLPGNLSFIVGTRPAAHSQLKIAFTDKISLRLFDWETVKKYITDYYRCYKKRAVVPNSAVKKDVDTNPDNFATKIIQWLENGTNKLIAQTLARPLHVELFCQSFDYHFERWMLADTAAAQQEVVAAAPWNQSALNRSKLYHLITVEKFRKHLNGYMKAGETYYTGSTQYISMLTQLMLIRLREAAFTAIFAQDPLHQVHYFDPKTLDLELYRMGFITQPNDNSGKKFSVSFAYRIFAEYFCAQYLLVGLTRAEDDVYYKHAQTIVAENHYDPAYEQVWCILGEMIRYGEEFLNVVPLAGMGAEIDVSNFLPFRDDDLIGNHRRFFYGCLRGTQEKQIKKTDKFYFNDWDYEEENDGSDDEELDDTQLKKYQRETSLKALLVRANASKDSACSVVHYVLTAPAWAKPIDQIENWVYHFYYAHTDEALKTLPSPLPPAPYENSLSNLAHAINHVKWVTRGGYWDVDAYLPALRFMTKKLYLIAAAYFIQRIENRNSAHYNYGVAHEVHKIILALSLAPLDKSSLRLFLMMVQSCLRQAYIPITPLFSAVPHIVFKAILCIKDTDMINVMMAIDTLYAVGMLFELPLFIKFRDGQYFLVMQLPAKPDLDPQKAQCPITGPEKDYIVRRLIFLKGNAELDTRGLPPIQWDTTESDNLSDAKAQPAKTATPVQYSMTQLIKFFAISGVTAAPAAASIMAPTADTKSSTAASGGSAADQKSPHTAAGIPGANAPPPPPATVNFAETILRHPDLPADYVQFNTLAEGDCLFISVAHQSLLQHINKPIDAAKGYPSEFGAVYKRLFGTNGDIPIKRPEDMEELPAFINVGDDTTIKATYNFLLHYDGNRNTIKKADGRIIETLFCEIFRNRVITYIQDHPTLFQSDVGTGVAWNNYLKRMRNRTEWGGPPEIRAMSLMLGPIRVYQIGNVNFMPFPYKADTDTPEFKAEKAANNQPIALAPIYIIHAPAREGGNDNNHYHFAIDKNDLPLAMLPSTVGNNQVLAYSLSAGAAAKIHSPPAASAKPPSIDKKQIVKAGLADNSMLADMVTAAPAAVAGTSHSFRK